MIYVLINWIYAAGITFLAGSASMTFLVKCFKSKKENNIFHILFLGIAVVTVYAQIFSLFGGVGIAANAILIFGSIAYLFGTRRNAKLKFKSLFQDTTEHMQRRNRFALYMVLLLGLLISALLSAGETKLLDTEWYHAQAIRWIEEFGSVKGVANLFEPIGFNSSQHYLDALFGMKFIFGQSMHALGGYFACLTLFHGICRLAGWRRHRFHTADALAAAEIIYAVIITAFYADPYTDTLPNCLIFFILIEWLKLLELQREECPNIAEPDIFSYGFLCLLGVYAVSVKTSAAFIVLLVVYPAYLLLKRREWKQIGSYLLTGVFLIGPFFLTNIKISGYLVFLASKVDLFPVKWKVKKEILEYAVDSMIFDVRRAGAAMDEVVNNGLSWIPKWFLNDSVSHQILYIGVLLLIVFDLIHITMRCIKRKKTDGLMLLTRMVVYAGILYWLFTLPQVRYCWALFLFVLTVIPSWYVEIQGDGKVKKSGRMIQGMVIGSSLILLMFTGFYSLRTAGYAADNIPHYLLRQADYARYEMVPVEKDGLTFYVREEGGAITCGYYVFPYLNDETILDRLEVGDKLSDGFYLKDVSAK